MGPSGFDLRDAAYMVATIQQLVWDSEGTLLEKAYNHHRIAPDQSLAIEEMGPTLEAYLVHWFVGDDAESISILLSNRSLLVQSIPHWEKLVSMATGHAKAMEYKRQNLPLLALADTSARRGHNALSSLFSFEDMHRIVGGITTSFASYWESECQSMKNALVDMDTHHTGRVPLSKFYSKTLDSEWRFGESESYLRELGALDETGWRGKQVIIANYIQGASNCIVSATHYLVCCVNECEALQGELEVAIGGPVSNPQQILEIVKGMSSAPIEGSLSEQLEKIATTHNGVVPLHGRLFAQWLHYVFPRECPFPHKVGTTSARTPNEYGDDFIVSAEIMGQHAAARSSTALQEQMVEQDEAQWMSQWSEEEELIVDYSLHLTAPWDRSRRMLLVGLVFVALALAGFGGMSVVGKSAGTLGGDSFNCKA